MKTTKTAFVMILLVFAMPAFGQKVLDQKVLGQKVLVQKKQVFPEGAWWREQRYVSMLSLTTDQQKRMDAVFQQSRIRLIELTANLDKEEVILEPLMEADRLDEPRVVTQIDKVADARAELEKANARMLLGLRQVLTPEQWTMINTTANKNLWPLGLNWTLRK